MSILEQVESTLNEKHIKYFKGNGTSSNIFCLPYRSIDYQRAYTTIYMEIIEDTYTIKFTLAEKANVDKDISSIKNDLLDLNSDLNFGSLSMQNGSAIIEYRVDYQLDDGAEFSYITYNVFIVRCLNVFDELRKRNLI